MTLAGFPHSDIPGSKLVCSSPRLIAAYYVLHRLPAPRHPPSALSSLTTKKRSFSKRHQHFPCYPDSIFKDQAKPPCRRLGWNSVPAWETLRGFSCGSGFPGVLVENTGIEPVTSWLQTRRSPI